MLFFFFLSYKSTGARKGCITEMLISLQVASIFVSYAMAVDALLCPFSIVGAVST